MTTTTSTAATAAGPRPPIVTRPLLLRFVSILGASISFYLLLSVVPRYAPASGAGLATASLMGASVAGELASPRLIARFGYRVTLGAGLLMMGVPALLLTASRGLPWIIAVCLVRGVGFGFTVVAGGALTASLLPAERRGEGLALVGIVSGIPSLVGLPLGVWLAAHLGYTPVSVAAALAPLAALASVPGLPDREPTKGPAQGVVAGLRNARLLRPTLVFAATTTATGIIVTFLPLAVPATATALVTAALFVQPAAATCGRLLSGRLGDRHGTARLVLPGLVTAAAGTLLTAFTHSPFALVTGVAVFGLGFGVTSNASSTLMYSRVAASEYGVVSALWNFAYDAGMGAGAAGFGVLSARTGYPTAFALTAALMLTALTPALRDRRAAAER
jgi:predicted MFS family arabinose efflux permease